MRMDGYLCAGSLVAALVLAGWVEAADRATTPTEAAQPADNSGRNTRDSGGTTLTPQGQGSSASDVDLTRRIRQAIVKDGALSTNAHNVKIMTVNGVVTLRGPVANAAEKASVAAKAQDVTGVKQVDNQLEIAAR